MGLNRKNKLKILLWGIYSPWTMNFVENFLLKDYYEIWILNRGNKKEYKKYIDFYKEKGIHLIEVSPSVSEVFDGKASGNYFKIWYSHILTIKAVMKEGPFDLINMHYVNYSDLVDVILLKYLMRTNLILSYWGSDLLREKASRLSSIGNFVKCADFITFDNKDLELAFKEIYKWSDKKAMKTVLFGLPVLDIIDEKRSSGFESNIREQWGISEDKIVIAIGYNGMPEQQHKRILKAVRQLETEYKEKIILLLQMSYGGTKEYRRSVLTAAKRTGCECIDVQSFLSNEEVAELRIITDIFINAQVTDAFSGSVCENLFADTVLINAGWLRYKELEMYPFEYLEFGKFNEVEELIKAVLERKPDTSSNRELVWKLRSWECCSLQWEKVYRRVGRQW